MFEITLTGILGKDPEMHYTPNGKAVTTMNVAVKKRNGTTVWVQVEAWEKLAEVCNQYLHKGSRVLVIGDPRSEGYQSKDGKIRSALKVSASSVEFLSSKQDHQNEPEEYNEAEIAEIADIADIAEIDEDFRL